MVLQRNFTSSSNGYLSLQHVDAERGLRTRNARSQLTCMDKEVQHSVGNAPCRNRHAGHLTYRLRQLFQRHVALADNIAFTATPLLDGINHCSDNITGIDHRDTTPRNEMSAKGPKCPSETPKIVDARSIQPHSYFILPL